LVQTLRAVGKDPGLLCSIDVADSLSRFLQPLRAADVRSDGGPRFQQDDGIVLVAAQHSGNRFKFFGYIWWISQAVDPLWGRFEIDPESEALTEYAIKCGVRRTRDRGYGLSVTRGRHLRKLVDRPEPGDIEKAWASGQLSSELDLWFFDFRTPNETSWSLL
jgi:hypothetical protein